MKPKPIDVLEKIALQSTKKGSIAALKIAISAVPNCRLTISHCG
jgi:hypothetical protein